MTLATMSGTACAQTLSYHLKLEEGKQMARRCHEPAEIGGRGRPPIPVADSNPEYVVEFIGAFFLTLVVVASVLSGSVSTPLAAARP